MRSLRKLGVLVIVAGLGAGVLAGCATQTEPQPTAEAPPTQEDWAQGLDEDVAAALSELSEADRNAALAQKVCPVSDQPLGSMGAPPKVTVNGQEVFICCEGCQEDLQAKPDEYLAKLQKE